MGNLHDAYFAAVAADDAYHAALVADYGKKACDARYDSRRNAATPRLAALRTAKVDADAAMHAMWMAKIDPSASAEG